MVCYDDYWRMWGCFCLNAACNKACETGSSKEEEKFTSSTTTPEPTFIILTFSFTTASYNHYNRDINMYIYIYSH